MTKGGRDLIVNEIQRANNIINVINGRDKLQGIMSVVDCAVNSPDEILLGLKGSEAEFNYPFFQTSAGLKWDSLFQQRVFFMESKYFL